MESTATISMESEEKLLETEHESRKLGSTAPAKKSTPAKAKTTDVWDEVNTFRKALTVNSRGYLATSAALVIGACFMVSLVVGAVLAMPVVALITTGDQVRKFLVRRKEGRGN